MADRNDEIRETTLRLVLWVYARPIVSKRTPETGKELTSPPAGLSSIETAVCEGFARKKLARSRVGDTEVRCGREAAGTVPSGSWPRGRGGTTVRCTTRVFRKLTFPTAQGPEITTRLKLMQKRQLRKRRGSHVGAGSMDSLP